MRLLILGATGPAGAWTARTALEHGHDVTLYVRDADRVPEDLKRSDKVRVFLHLPDYTSPYCYIY